MLLMSVLLLFCGALWGIWLKRRDREQMRDGSKTTVIVLGALILMLAAGVAVAKTFTCTTTCYGTSERDVITGTDKSQTFYLKAGNDVAYAKGGADTVYGGAGNDDMYGANGADTLRDWDGQGDYDEAFGGANNDTINVVDGDSHDSGSCGDGGDNKLRADSRTEANQFSGCEDVYID